jgi:phosphate transport system protein
MSRHLVIEIDKLKQSILKIAGVVEEAVLIAVRALEQRDRELAISVIQNDTKVDHMEVEIEEECLKVLALHQPVAFDLRFIVAVMKINNDLERIADLAVNIAERAVFLCTVDPIEIPFDLPGMVEKTVGMLKQSLNALVRLDAGLARAVRLCDDEVDSINRQAYEKVQRRILENPGEMERLIHILSVARHLERIADLATNIGEDVVFLVEGTTIKHHAEQHQEAGR